MTGTSVNWEKVGVVAAAVAGVAAAVVGVVQVVTTVVEAKRTIRPKDKEDGHPQDLR